MDVRASRIGNPDRAKKLSQEHRRLHYLKNRERLLQEMAAYRRENPEVVAATRKKTYEKLKSKRIAYNIEYQRNNPEKCKEWRRKWEGQNKDLKNASRRRYQAYKLRAVPSWANHEEIRKFYEIAVMLTNETGVPHHVDHIIPLKGKYVSGLHVEDNLQVVTWVENLSKANKHESDAHHR